MPASRGMPWLDFSHAHPPMVRAEGGARARGAKGEVGSRTGILTDLLGHRPDPCGWRTLYLSRL
jgi:hypothetical protein